MKKITILIFITALITSQNIFAQTEMGTWTLGGSSNLGFLSTESSRSANKTKNFTIDINPGYFVSENFALGLGLDLNTQKQGEFKSTTTIIGPWARYYFNGAIFLGGSIGAVKAKDESSNGTNESNGNALEFELGYAYFLNENIAIEPAINYLKAGGDFDFKTVGITIGISVYL